MPENMLKFLTQEIDKVNLLNMFTFVSVSQSL